jgi:hypothetical protein
MGVCFQFESMKSSYSSRCSGHILFEDWTRHGGVYTTVARVASALKVRGRLPINRRMSAGCLISVEGTQSLIWRGVPCLSMNSTAPIVT